MAVNYKIYQSKANNASKGLYYARAAYRESVGLKKLAEIMQANCTVKYSDILAVLTELAEVMKTELLNSNSVKIEGLGTFRVTLKSKGCANLKEFEGCVDILCNSFGDFINFNIIFVPRYR